MKIRAITLSNVRRFIDPVTVGPFGDGITLLCQPNESGKSTLFDALHAVFFVRHTGFPGEVSSLQPYSGGKVSVAVELEIDGQAWRIAKTWQKGAGGEAGVWRRGVLQHQGDQADHWIADLVAGEGGGPSGLLWVRQGRTTLDAAGSKKEAETEQAHRRDLLTLISGAMDAVTGGQRMDDALEVCRVSLSALETSTGRPKAGGAWAEAEASVDTYRSESDRLAGLVAGLRDDLERRRSLQASLTELEDPAEVAIRKAALKDAEAAFANAERHADLIESARTKARLASQTLRTSEEDAKRRDALLGRYCDASERSAKADAAAKTAVSHQEAAQVEHETAKAELAKAAADAQKARADLTATQRRDAILQSASQRADLEKRISDAEAAEKTRVALAAEAASGPPAEVVQKANAAIQAVQAARITQDQSAPRVVFDYLDGALPVSLDGKDLVADVEHKVPADQPLDLPGIGRMTVLSAATPDANALQAAEDALANALSQAGVGDFQALEIASKAAEQARQLAERAMAQRDALAPDGIGALKVRLATLTSADAAPTDVPDTSVAEAALALADSDFVKAQEAEIARRAEFDAMRDAATAAKAAAKELAGQYQSLKAEIEALPVQTADDGTRHIALADASAEATAQLAALEDKAPDQAALKARLDRLRSVDAQTTTREQTLRLQLAELRATIAARAEDGVEEDLVDMRAKLQAAEDRLQNIRFDVDVWRRLRDALEAAQGAARDRYFAPVAKELRPLLEDLWGDAELVWADDTLLPKALVRKGTEEKLDILSGGTQEQIAFFVRLAFARLLAKAGRHAPLILDDALVFSDDDRIERMFDALHAAADDLQIIVLSCRQRAFRDLGAPEVTFESVSAGP